MVLDSGRPVIRSGIDPNADPAGPFAFSAAGMGTQLPINEVVFLLPHRAPRASAFEYGLMAGGIGTVAFYLSVGRSSEVGDVQQMVQHSGLSTWGVTAIFGGVALAEIVRLALSKRYLNFFATPTPQNELAFGVSSDF